MMDLTEAWTTLGKDIKEVFEPLSKLNGLSEKIKYISSQFEIAKRLAKNLMALHHPDRNPNDIDAANRFRRIQLALEIIENETNQFINKATQKLENKSIHHKKDVYIKFL